MCFLTINGSLYNIKAIFPTGILVSIMIKRVIKKKLKTCFFAEKPVLV